MHQGLLNGAGAVLGPDSRSFDYRSEDLQLGAFDLVFWMVVTIVLLNCVFGIMLDTFAALREQEEEQNDAVNNYCFICCTNRVEFASPREFKRHWGHEHNLLHYVYLVHRVSSLPAMERNGLENFVLHCLKGGVESWMPFENYVVHSPQLGVEDDGDGSDGSDDDDKDPMALLLKTVMEMKAEIAQLKEAQQNSTAIPALLPRAANLRVAVPAVATLSSRQ